MDKKNKNILNGADDWHGCTKQTPSSLQQRIAECKKIVEWKNAAFPLLIILFLFCFMPTGCGKKGDPLPPQYQVPRPPFQLDHTLEGATLLLTWHNHNQEPGKERRVKDEEEIRKGEEWAGIEIFRAVKLRSPDACRTCPPEFELIASLPPSTSQYRQNLEKGFVYFYKVRCYTEKHFYSDYSKTIEFGY